MKSTALQFTLSSAMRTTLIAYAAVLAALGGGSQAWSQYDPGMINLALGRTATATETDFGGLIPYGVDGNRDGNFSNNSVFYGNANSSNPPLFYQVDLGQNDYINRVQFLPRTDAVQNVFGNFNISIYPDDGTGNPATTPSFSQNYNTTYFGPAFATAALGAAAPGGTNGRYVRITRLDNNYWLTFAEMEVVGASTPLQYTAANNIALGKPVTLDPGDSAAFGSTIASGNDGDINGDIHAPSQGPIPSSVHPVFHANVQGATNAVYWEVDLGANTPLSYANLFSRMVENSTFQFDVKVYDHNHNLVSTSIVNNSDVTGTTPGYDHAIDLTGVTGEFVRVTPGPDAGVSNLAFTELQVFAANQPGDLNRDGKVTVADIQVMMQALANLDAYKSTYAPGITDQQLALIEDVNDDGLVNNLDIQSLISLVANNTVSGIGGGSVLSVPEPSTIFLASLGMLGLIVVRRFKISHLLPPMHVPVMFTLM